MAKYIYHVKKNVKEYFFVDILAHCYVVKYANLVWNKNVFFNVITKSAKSLVKMIALIAKKNVDLIVSIQNALKSVMQNVIEILVNKLVPNY